MKKLTGIFLLLLMAALLLGGCTPAGRIGEGNISIAGYVLEHEDPRFPVEGAAVRIGSFAAETDDDGYFRFGNLFSAGTKEIIVQKEDSNFWTEIKKISIYESRKNVEIYLKDKDIFSGTVEGKIDLTGASSAEAEVQSQRKESQSSPDVRRTDSSELRKDFSDAPRYVEGEVLVRFKSGIDAASLESHQAQGEFSALEYQDNVFLIRDDSLTAEKLYEHYQGLEAAASVSYNRIAYLMSDNPEQTIPDDPRFGEQWYHWDLYSDYAWPITKGSFGVRVAVIDTGYIPHEDMESNINEDKAVYYLNGDSGSGAIDEDADEQDGIISHGTHMAGLIGAVGNNNTGIAGMSWQVDIMPIRVFQSDELGQYANEVDLMYAVSYAVDEDADIINLSLGFPSNEEETDSDYEEGSGLSWALEDAYNQGVTVIAAAGNGGEDFSYYPASSEYTISVAATGFDTKRASYTNAGEDLLAPGGNSGGGGGIISTHGYAPDNTDDYLSIAGTSCSAALVSGAAALLTSEGIEGPDNILAALQNSADSDTGIINVYRALTGEEPPVYEPEELYEQMKVLAAVKVGNTYYVVSDRGTVNHRGVYDIGRVKAGDRIKIIGWVDLNDSGSISIGDYFGSSSLFTLDQYENRSGVNFTVSRLEESYLMSEDEELPEISFRPPPQK